MFLQVYVSVANENDNAPLTLLPVYYPHVPENSPDGTLVVQLHAEDHDLDPRQRLTYRITAGNPESFFAIETDTGNSTIITLIFWYTYLLLSLTPGIIYGVISRRLMTKIDPIEIIIISLKICTEQLSCYHIRKQHRVRFATFCDSNIIRTFSPRKNKLILVIF